MGAGRSLAARCGRQEIRAPARAATARATCATAWNPSCSSSIQRTGLHLAWSRTGNALLLLPSVTRAKSATAMAARTRHSSVPVMGRLAQSELDCCTRRLSRTRATFGSSCSYSTRTTMSTPSASHQVPPSWTPLRRTQTLLSARCTYVPPIICVIVCRLLLSLPLGLAVFFSIFEHQTLTNMRTRIYW